MDRNVSLTALPGTVGHLDDGIDPRKGAGEDVIWMKNAGKKPMRRNEAFRLLSEKLRKRSEGRPQTPSEVLLRQLREER